MIHHVRMWDIYGYLWKSLVNCVSFSETTRQLPNSFEDPTAALSLSSSPNFGHGQFLWLRLLSIAATPHLVKPPGMFSWHKMDGFLMFSVLEIHSKLPYHITIQSTCLLWVEPVPPVAPWKMTCRSSVTSSPARKTRSRSVALGSCHMLIKASKLPDLPEKVGKNCQLSHVSWWIWWEIIGFLGKFSEYPNFDGLNHLKSWDPFGFYRQHHVAESPNGWVLVILQPSLCRPAPGLNPICETSLLT